MVAVVEAATAVAVVGVVEKCGSAVAASHSIEDRSPGPLDR